MMKTRYAALYSSKSCVTSLNRMQLSQSVCHIIMVRLGAKLAKIVRF